LTRAQNAPQKFFVTKLTGATQIIPFTAADEIKFQPASHALVIQQFLESNFTPTEWHIRADATHCKSHTFTSGKEARSAFQFQNQS
jgi:hypothetical protein